MPSPELHDDETFLTELDITPCTAHVVTPARRAAAMRRAEALLHYFGGIEAIHDPHSSLEAQQAKTAAAIAALHEIYS